MALTKVKAGNIILTTPAASSNDVTPATTQYVTTAIDNLVDTAPSTLNTLNELAAALGDDVNFSTTVTNSIATKLPLAGGTMTGNLAFTKEDPNITLTDSSASRTLAMFVDNNNSVIRASGPLLLQVGSQSAITIDASRNVTLAGTLGVTGVVTGGEFNVGVNYSGRFNAKQAGADAYGIVLEASANDRWLRMGHNGTSGIIDATYNASGGHSPIELLTSGATRIHIATAGNVGIGFSDPLNKFVVAHQSHGVAIDYVGATLPYQAGLFTSSTGLTETAYGDLNIKARTDYGGNYGIGFFTSVTNSTPRKAMAITSGAEVEHHPSTGSGLHIQKVLPRVTPNYPNAGQSGTAQNWYQVPRGESGIIHYGNTNNAGGEYRCAGFIVYSAAEANNSPVAITISVTESVRGDMVAFDVSGGYIRVQNTYGYGIELMGYVQAFRRA